MGEGGKGRIISKTLNLSQEVDCAKKDGRQRARQGGDRTQPSEGTKPHEDSGQEDISPRQEDTRKLKGVVEIVLNNLQYGALNWAGSPTLSPLFHSMSSES